MVPASSLIAAAGWSTKADALRAGREAAEGALARLPSARPRLALAFGSSWFDQPMLLKGLRSVVGEIPLIGGSTAGEITPEGPVSHSCVVLLLASDALTCSIGVGSAAHQRPREAGQKAAYAAVQGFHGGQRVGFLLFGDGLVTGYADVVRGLQEVLGTNALIVGGMAGDDLRFSETFQYADDRVISHGLVGALLGGQVAVGVGIEHGFAPISKPRRITRAQANVLFELDRLPAASVYDEYFGTELIGRMRNDRLTRQAVAFPLGIQHGSEQRWLLRNVVSFQPDGSLACTGEMLEGAWLQLMIGSRQLALEAASAAAQQAVRSVNRVSCVLVFDSVVRRTLLGPHYAAIELERIRRTVGQAVPVVGCYTYGEQAAFGARPVYERSLIQTGSVLVVALGT